MDINIMLNKPYHLDIQQNSIKAIETIETSLLTIFFNDWAVNHHPIYCQMTPTEVIVTVQPS